jgi:hypothetical protein
MNAPRKPHIYRNAADGPWYLTTHNPSGKKTRHVLGFDKTAAAEQAQKLWDPLVDGIRRGPGRPRKYLSARLDAAPPATSTSASNGSILPPRAAPVAPRESTPTRLSDDRIRALFEQSKSPSNDGLSPAADDDAALDSDSAAPRSSGVLDLGDSEKKKLADVAATVVTNGQELFLTWAMKTYGSRAAGEPDEEYQSMACKSWAAIIERMLGPREVSPVGVLLVSSVGMAIQMYVTGKELPPKPATLPADKRTDKNGVSARRAPVPIFEQASTWKFPDENEDPLAG